MLSLRFFLNHLPNIFFSSLAVVRLIVSFLQYHLIDSLQKNWITHLIAQHDSSLFPCFFSYLTLYLTSSSKPPYEYKNVLMKVGVTSHHFCFKIPNKISFLVCATTQSHTFFPYLEFDKSLFYSVISTRPTTLYYYVGCKVWKNSLHFRIRERHFYDFMGSFSLLSRRDKMMQKVMWWRFSNRKPI